ncbi:hypothetical protein WA556_002336 [Blastocystis sp. ATCC 50177/Nand II]
MVHPKVAKELAKMKAENNPDIGIVWESPLKDNFIFFILGPKDTIYEGAYFKIHCHIPDKYPFVPPMMSFMTKVWHPNISSVTGAICLDILKDKWTPAMNMETALLSIQALLTAAEPTDPQDHVVAEEYMNHHEQYEKTAREWVQKYAKKDIVTEKEQMIEKAVKRGKDRNYVHTYLCTNHWNDKGL